MSYKDIPLFCTPYPRPSVNSMIEALVHARSKLPGACFICHALPYNKAGDYLRHYIMHSLEHHDNLGQWLRNECRKRHQIMSWGEPEVARRQWINWMLKGLRAELKEQKMKMNGHAP